MFDFLFGVRRNKELDAIMNRIDSNVANNYKDAAQENLKEFEKLLSELVESGKLSEKQKIEYQNSLAEYRSKMKEFTHKDQKPYWT
ncbi:MAG: hypothetical protein IJZ82_04595 [Lachnospiraceae bacterium]|nr:hypothetical protein [Lachnospiraceae bacterium]